MNRTLDFLLASLLLVLSLPLMLIIAIFLFTEKNSSVIYKQKRIGLHGREFRVYKFRTMIKDAEKSGPVLTKNYDDKRITKIGRLLRKTSLDELPQLVNVLKGEMSLIGPRPERLYFHKKFRKIKNWDNRLKIKPGITGLAQTENIEDPHNPKEKIKYDLKYIKNRNFWLDLKILITSIKYVLRS